MLAVSSTKVFQPIRTCASPKLKNETKFTTGFSLSTVRGRGPIQQRSKCTEFRRNTVGVNEHEKDTVQRTCKGSWFFQKSALATNCLLCAGILSASLPCSAAVETDGLQAFERVVQDSGAFGAVVFVVGYAASSVLLVPASALTLGAGYLFGPLAGTALVSAGSTIGAAASFLLSRSFAKPAVERRLVANKRFNAVNRAVSAKGAQVVLLLRLSPLFPFTLLNYGLGLSEIGFWQYLGASWLGMLPGTFAYVYLGGLGKATMEAASGDGSLPPIKLAFYAVGAAATLAATRIVSSAAAKALDDAQEG
uniref:Snare associated golgi protein n=1 Tax=Tetraselmis sp. GSL018 TaxID=582737 RepID=A0A061QVE1_9CHLO